MVTRITSGKDIRGALNYNEEKVADGKAKCIQASGFMKAPADLKFHHKLKRFTDLNKRNIRTKTNTMHISINFHKSESLTTDVLNSIASSYMDKIGFGEQPFLVYEHFDAAHQHMHIVTTLIQEDGKRIPINKIGENESEKARKEIEVDFNLVKAQEQKKEKLIPAKIEKAVYGKSETKKSISDIVQYLTERYKFTSLPELNTLLKEYNVIADPGKEGTAMFKRKGLVYSILDEQGKRVGVPIKASSLYFKPTLAKLEEQFIDNEKLRIPFRTVVMKKVFDALGTNPKSIAALQSALHAKGIELITRIASDGRVFGLTFIDHESHTVFNGSDLSKQLSAKKIIELLAANKDKQPADTSNVLLSFSSPPWAWKRSSKPENKMAQTWVGKKYEITDRPSVTSTKVTKSSNPSTPSRKHNPAQTQLRFDDRDEQHDVSKVEYLWTGITMTYGAGLAEPSDPLGLNRKKKRRKKRTR